MQSNHIFQSHDTFRRSAIVPPTKFSFLMISQAQLLTIALPLFSASVFAGIPKTAASNNTSTEAACNLEDLYLRPNASNSYAIPAIVQDLSKSTNTLSDPIQSSLTQNWHVINALGQTADIYSHENGTQELEQLLLLDTSRNQTNPPAIPPALVACSFVFDLPESDLGKSDNGSCVSLVGQQCVNDIHSAAQNLSIAEAQKNGTKIFDACTAISNGLTTLPTSCPKKSTAKSYGFSISEWAGIDLTYNAAAECPSGPKTAPLPIYQESTTVQAGNDTIYDQWARTTKPILLAFFSNGTVLQGNPFAYTKLLCTTPKNIAAGSHVPTSAGDHVASVDVISLLAFFVSLNVFLFCML